MFRDSAANTEIKTSEVMVSFLSKNILWQSSSSDFPKNWLNFALWAANLYQLTQLLRFMFYDIDLNWKRYHSYWENQQKRQ